MKYSLILLLFVFSQIHAQIGNENLSQGLTEQELTKAKEDYKQMMKTETWVNNHKLTKDFANKTNAVLLKSPTPPKDRESLIQLLEQNLGQTQFKSISEAKDYIAKMDESEAKMKAENKELFEMMSRATQTQRREIAKPFFELSMKERGLR
ncbi:hypothetical protein HUK80_06420 [Flavobacterium sp. MAH-1]|uniref:LTXXQ motif family protein n=1 Tax=Flavobacterium agri TaxID=2743471 RepID=A0A7Y9C6N0_9FLAO|nr:hypothetical protein [Flavobacterium agri]NUY80523.1 hypothetical protein [Flavobacterium agri]NYA70548.1 hypothetical protein [Flavobacterium agri]